MSADESLMKELHSFREDFHMWSHEFEKLFGKPRKPKDKINQKHANIALSIQKITEEIYLKILNHLYKLTSTPNLCISGGVGLNALANGQIYTKTPFKNIHILGPAGDSGAALGAALYTYKVSHPEYISDSLPSLSFGTSYTDSAIETILKKHHLSYTKLLEDELIKRAALALHHGKIIGWFQGKCELGPRALGNRSILCKPFPGSMKTKVNIIKIREEFRPFAGSILQEHVHEYFDVPEKSHYSPFMNFCFKVKKNKQKAIAAIVHADKTCRIQTVNKDNNLYYKLIKEFYKLSGIPCVLNTSFNLKGEPIVESPEQAAADFTKTKMDMLFIGSFIVDKE